MMRSPRVYAMFPVCLTLAMLSATRAIADKGNLTLRDGTQLRGDVTETADEVLLRTPYGERRYARSEIQRIEYDAAQDADADDDSPTSRPASGRPSSRPSTRPTQANDSDDEPQSQPTSRPVAAKYKGVPPPPNLSERDITRLKLLEYPLDGPPEPVHVEFLKKRGEPALEELAARALRDNVDVELGWERVLEKGRGPEKLQLILRGTGLKFADRIAIHGDTETFGTFRKRVLPVILKGCAKSGCHGGNSTAYFRFPIGAQSTDEFAYTSYYILDSIYTPAGPFFDRDLPEESAILKYLTYPQGRKEGAPPLHPTVKNAKILPQLNAPESREYRDIADWLSSLRVPKPEYKLDYKNPDWLERLSQPPRAAAAEGVDAAADGKSASKPASRPHNRAAPTTRPGKPTPRDHPRPPEKP